jgi:Ion channel
MFWAIIYLLTIPSFAALYERESGDFFQSTATSDPRFLQARARVESDLGESLNLLNQAGPHVDSSGYFGGQSARFTVSLRGLSQDGHALAVVTLDEWGSCSSCPLLYIGEVTFEVTGNCSGYPPLSLEPTTDLGQSNLQSSKLFSPYFREQDSMLGNVVSPRLDLRFDGTASLQRACTGIANIHRGLKGDSSFLPGSGLRMIYLSTTTITTLGFGDITPLTDRARLLIGSEAIIGMVWLGLFLNAVGRRFERPRNL